MSPVQKVQSRKKQQHLCFKKKRKIGNFRFDSQTNLRQRNAIR